MKHLSVREAVALLNERISKYPHPRTGEPQQITKQAFIKSLIPLMADPRRGDAQRIGNQWVIDATSWWMWLVYAQRRAELISDGQWSQRHPWAIEDMEAIALDSIEQDD